ncbi:hypothetical protein HK405_008936, partial [Cladochytrium tenue]
MLAPADPVHVAPTPFGGLCGRRLPVEHPTSPGGIDGCYSASGVDLVGGVSPSELVSRLCESRGTGPHGFLRSLLVDTSAVQPRPTTQRVPADAPSPLTGPVTAASVPGALRFRSLDDLRASLDAFERARLRRLRWLTSSSNTRQAAVVVDPAKNSAMACDGIGNNGFEKRQTVLHTLISRRPVYSASACDHTSRLLVQPASRSAGCDVPLTPSAVSRAPHASGLPVRQPRDISQTSHQGQGAHGSSASIELVEYAQGAGNGFPKVEVWLDIVGQRPSPPTLLPSVAARGFSISESASPGASGTQASTTASLEGFPPPSHPTPIVDYISASRACSPSLLDVVEAFFHDPRFKRRLDPNLPTSIVIFDEDGRPDGFAATAAGLIADRLHEADRPYVTFLQGGLRGLTRAYPQLFGLCGADHFGTAENVPELDFATAATVATMSASSSCSEIAPPSPPPSSSVCTFTHHEAFPHLPCLPQDPIFELRALQDHLITSVWYPSSISRGKSYESPAAGADSGVISAPAVADGSATTKPHNDDATGMSDLPCAIIEGQLYIASCLAAYQAACDKVRVRHIIRLGWGFKDECRRTPPRARRKLRSAWPRRRPDDTPDGLLPCSTRGDLGGNDSSSGGQARMDENNWCQGQRSNYERSGCKPNGGGGDSGTPGNSVEDEAPKASATGRRKRMRWGVLPEHAAADHREMMAGITRFDQDEIEAAVDAMLLAGSSGSRGRPPTQQGQPPSPHGPPSDGQVRSGSRRARSPDDVEDDDEYDDGGGSGGLSHAEAAADSDVSLDGDVGAGLVAYHDFPIEDSPRQPVARLLRRVAKLIDSCLARGQPVLVHCHAGVSRSATVVVAYLMLRRGMALVDAFETVYK